MHLYFSNCVSDRSTGQLKVNFKDVGFINSLSQTEISELEEACVYYHEKPLIKKETSVETEVIGERIDPTTILPKVIHFFSNFEINNQ